MIGRLAVVGLFGALTISKADLVRDAFAAAARNPSFANLQLAGYHGLRLAVISAFTLFVAIRPAASSKARDPIAFAACAGAIASLVLLESPQHDAAGAAVVAGVLVTLAGCVWQLVSVLALGRCFGILPEARGLVTRGPYRIVRHPLYLGELTAAAGLVIALPSAWNVLCAVVFGLSQYVRMRLEEQALTRRFAEYADYAHLTPRLIPHVRKRVSGRRTAVRPVSPESVG